MASNHQNDFGELIDAVIAELKSRRGWISPKLTSTPNTDPTAGDAVRLLDYACGAGTVSKVSRLDTPTYLNPPIADFWTNKVYARP